MADVSTALSAEELGVSPETRRESRRERMRAGLRFRGKLLASYMCAVLVLLVGLVSFVQMQLAEEQAARADHRRQILRAALEIQVAVLSAESAQRGYLLTKDPAFLQTELGPFGTPLEARIERLEALASGQAGIGCQRQA